MTKLLFKGWKQFYRLTDLYLTRSTLITQICDCLANAVLQYTCPLPTHGFHDQGFWRKFPAVTLKLTAVLFLSEVIDCDYGTVKWIYSQYETSRGTSEQPFWKSDMRNIRLYC